MKERLKLLRKSLRLTQAAFGDKLGLDRNTIANYEDGNRKPSNAILKLLCKTYNVNYLWLTEGKGEMFEISDTALDDLIMQYDLNEVDTFLIKSYLNMSKEERAEFADVILNKLLTILKQELHTDQKH
ncbi:helix-turn-helix transcriptional regulator [[Clostridium] innocuum]|uniref:helix-turn-helix domain-containing protein n=1 Tax=Clostridium sp. DFI.1.208 TaxID=2965527 RepID=UPI001E2A15D6|nr:helix-turn-helix transcriptional regulator [[Clostridium] innocuum]MCC2847445.1 helix-turn-helix transcriptional regulator [[Clostridium] innocuum]MCC2851579.1 helix-turn-helix transcriptional regulator [[Clostridium] innocuum]MCC2855719.1 helix-turn-helix transcriptional regulator [[Clostridium] innocuum]MCQ5280309.1 helix-turn-helix transcriptional regulator [Clostridium sp. DFI.1.208]